MSSYENFFTIASCLFCASDVDFSPEMLYAADMDVMEAIRRRRSIRRYKREPIPDWVLREVLEAARLAPSWANSQVCSYVVVRDEKIREALSETLFERNPARMAVKEAPCVVCLVAKRHVSGYYRGQPVTDKGDWFMYDSGIAMEHIVLAAWNFGLGTCHIGAFDAKKAEQVLQIPEGYSIVAMTPIGYFEEMPEPRPRKSFPELVFLDVFGKSFPE
ncbi:MAG: nitroreductase family protein [Candidatus Bathyarchaeia archaeon]